MLPVCIMCSVDLCYPKERYAERLIKAEKETPPSTCVEKTITGLTIGIFASSCPFTAPFPSACCIPICMVMNMPYHGQNAAVFQEGCLSSGCIRDFTVLKKTFSDQQEILPTYQIPTPTRWSSFKEANSPHPTDKTICYVKTDYFEQVIKDSFNKAKEPVKLRSILVGGKNYIPKSKQQRMLT